MLNILLISDTHGSLSLINQLAKKHQADLVIHAGDFGFYDENSVERLSDRELRLLIVHSPVQTEPIEKQTPRKKLIDLVLSNQLLGDFPLYQKGEKQFDVPIYAVWGNHEDLSVINRLRSGHSVDNLHILDESCIYSIKDNDKIAFELFGIGGNFLPGKKLFDEPIGGKEGKVWSTLHQYGALYNQLRKKEVPSIFVSHVSPGKEPLLVRLMMHFHPNFWISGHMGAPFTCVWNQFSVREIKEAEDWMKTSNFLEETKKKFPHMSEEAKIAYDLIYQPIKLNINWMKQIWNMNLPDAHQGYSLIQYQDKRFSLQTFSRGFTIKL